MYRRGVSGTVVFWDSDGRRVAGGDCSAAGVASRDVWVVGVFSGRLGLSQAEGL